MSKVGAQTPRTLLHCGKSAQRGEVRCHGHTASGRDGHDWGPSLWLGHCRSCSRSVTLQTTRLPHELHTQSLCTAQLVWIGEIRGFLHVLVWSGSLHLGALGGRVVQPI